MNKHDIGFYLSMIKPEFTKGKNMKNQYAKKISELQDGDYSAVLKRVYKNELKDGRGFFMNFYFNINDEEYEYGQFVSEKTEFILYRDLLLPLGQYASHRGIDDTLKLKDVYFEFKKVTNGQYSNMVVYPLYETEAPVGSVNNTITNIKTNVTEDPSIDDFDDSFPY